MNSDQEHPPFSLEQLKWIADYAKRVGKDEALPIKNMLNYAYRGINDTEAFKEIDEIDKYYREEEERLICERADARIEKYLQTRFNKPEFDLDDEQIAAAIIKTVNDKIMTSKRDWSGIYRILVDKCHWVDSFKDFERKIIELKLAYLLYNIPQDKDFSYQSAVDGLSLGWPETYDKWLTVMDGSTSFNHRREVATTFYMYLKEQQKVASSY